MNKKDWRNEMLIAFDIDGTIVNDDKQVGDITLKTLYKLKDLGHILVPCTGPNYKDIPDILYDKNLISYIIATNGTLVYDTNKDKIINSEYFTPSRFIEIIDEIKDYHPSIDYASDGMSYTSYDILNNLEAHHLPVVSCKFIRQNRTGVEDIKEDIIKNKRNINRANILFKDLDDRLHLLNDQDKFDFTISTSTNFNAEIVPKGISKLSGLKYLQNLLKLNDDEIMFFGDNQNDYEALNSNFQTILMLNGLDSLKMIAKDITKYDNNHDGVGRYLIKYFNID